VSRRSALVLAMLATACVQTGSVGSDTSHTVAADDDDDDDDTSASADENDDDDSSESGLIEDPYAVCEDIDTTGEPFPDSCAPSPGDSPCLQCIKLVCCGELLSCPSFEACACQIDCADAGAPPDVCTESCGSTGEGCDLSGCGEVECDQVCAG
jgi:hypothetical protein